MAESPKGRERRRRVAFPAHLALLGVLALGFLAAPAFAQADSTAIARLGQEMRDKDEIRSSIAVSKLLAIRSDSASAVVRGAMAEADVSLKRRVLRALGACWNENPPLALDLCLQALDSDAEDVRLAAREALGQFYRLQPSGQKVFDDASLSALLERLRNKDSSERSRLAVVGVLRLSYRDSQIEPKILVEGMISARAAPATWQVLTSEIKDFLLELTGHDHATQAEWEAWWAANKDKEPERWFKMRLDRALESEKRAIEQITSLWKRLFEALRDQPTEHRVAITEALALQKPYDEVRRLAVEEIGRFPADEAVKLLIPLLKDGQRSLKQAVTRQLKQLKRKEATSPLLEILQEPGSMALRVDALDALGEIGDTVAVPAIRRIAERKAPADLVEPAILALGAIRHPGDSAAMTLCALAEEELLKPTAEQNSRFIDLCVQALSQMRYKSFPREESLAVACLAGPVLERGAPGNRVFAAGKLSAFPRRQVVQKLLLLLDPSAAAPEPLRAAAAGSLGKLGVDMPQERGAVLDRLVQAIQDGGDATALAAVQSLKRIVSAEQAAGSYVSLQKAVESLNGLIKTELLSDLLSVLAEELPADPALRPVYAQLLERKAQLIQSTDAKAAVPLYERLVEGFPAERRFLEGLAQCCREAQSYDRADQALKFLILKSQDDPKKLRESWVRRLEILGIRRSESGWLDLAKAMILEIEAAGSAFPSGLETELQSIRQKIAESAP